MNCDQTEIIFVSDAKVVRYGERRGQHTTKHGRERSNQARATDDVLNRVLTSTADATRLPGAEAASRGPTVAKQPNKGNARTRRKTAPHRGSDRQKRTNKIDHLRRAERADKATAQLGRKIVRNVNRVQSGGHRSEDRRLRLRHPIRASDQAKHRGPRCRRKKRDRNGVPVDVDDWTIVKKGA